MTREATPVEMLIGVLVSPAAAERAIAELLRIPVPQEAITFLTADSNSAAEAKGGGKSLGAGPGGVQQALTSGASPADAQFFRDILNKGRFLVIVRADSKPVAEAACAVLDRLGIGTHRTSEPASCSVAARAAVRHASGVAIVDLGGRITLGEGGVLLRDTVRELVEQGHKKIMLNLGRVTHIDSSGMGELVRALTAVRSRGGELKLVNVSLPVNEVLRITRLAALFDIAQDEAKGAVSFRASA